MSIDFSKITVRAIRDECRDEPFDKDRWWTLWRIMEINSFTTVCSEDVSTEVIEDMLEERQGLIKTYVGNYNE